MDNGLNNLDIENRKRELISFNRLYDIFGNNSFNLIERYNVSVGFATGYDRLLKLVETGECTKEIFYADPVGFIANFLFLYFRERGGNLPDIWSDNNIVYLKTEFGKTCITFEAEKAVPVNHREICNVYCRSFVKGMLSVFEALFPGIKINFFNQSSRRNGEDCVEGFQVVYP